MSITTGPKSIIHEDILYYIKHSVSGSAIICNLYSVDLNLLDQSTDITGVSFQYSATLSNASTLVATSSITATENELEYWLEYVNNQLYGVYPAIFVMIKLARPYSLGSYSADHELFALK